MTDHFAEGVEVVGDIDLTSAAVAQARSHLDSGQADQALTWLDTVPQPSRPPDLESGICYQAAKTFMQRGAWGTAQELLERANSVATTHMLQKRLGLVRNRRPYPIDDDQLGHALSRTLRSTRLQIQRLTPEVDAVWALGAYVSRGAKRGTPISRLIRMGKEELPTEEREGVAGVAGSLICHLLLEETEAIATADVVASIPANPARFASRGWSLPDEMARAAERHLSVPFEFGLLKSQAGGVELRGLSWVERRRAVRESMYVDTASLDGAAVLVVDDVITSGATLREAGRLLKQNGAGAVLGAALTHTEG